MASTSPIKAWGKWRKRSMVLRRSRALATRAFPSALRTGPPAGTEGGDEGGDDGGDDGGNDGGNDVGAGGATGANARVSATALDMGADYSAAFRLRPCAPRV